VRYNRNNAIMRRDYRDMTDILLNKQEEL